MKVEFAFYIVTAVCGDVPDYLKKWFCFYTWDSFTITNIIFQCSNEKKKKKIFQCSALYTKT